MPSRRAYLRTCGIALGLGVAGCLGAGRSSDEPTSTTDPGTTTATETPPTDAGTTTDAGTPGGTTTDGTTSPEPTTVPNPPEVHEVDPSTLDRGVPQSSDVESEREPFRAFVVGDRPDAPGNHYETPAVWVWNLTGEARAIELALTTGGTELLHERYEFPAGTPLAFDFREPRTYRLTIRVGSRVGTTSMGGTGETTTDQEATTTAGRTKTVTVERDRFHCNDSATDVIVGEENIETETITTLLYCTTTP